MSRAVFGSLAARLRVVALADIAAGGFPAVVHAAALVVTNNADSGPGSLHDAIEQANRLERSEQHDHLRRGARRSNDRVGLGTARDRTDPGDSGPNNSSSGIPIDGDFQTQLMLVNPPANLTLAYLTIAQGAVDRDFDAGGVEYDGSLTVISTTLRLNRAGFGAQSQTSARRPSTPALSRITLREWAVISSAATYSDNQQHLHRQQRRRHRRQYPQRRRRRYRDQQHLRRNRGGRLWRCDRQPAGHAAAQRHVARGFGERQLRGAGIDHGRHRSARPIQCQHRERVTEQARHEVHVLMRVSPAASRSCARPTSQARVPENMLYGIGSTATDRASGASCTGSVPVCVQDFRHRGQPSTGSTRQSASRDLVEQPFGDVVEATSSG